MIVYFITARELGTCKIGITNDVAARRASLQTASPAKLTVEATLQGSRKLEQEFHARFAKDRLNGEWFKITPELDAVIAEAAASPVLPFRPAKPSVKDEQVAEEELVRRSLERDRRAFAEAMASFERAGCFPRGDVPAPVHRAYRPAPVSGGQFADRYAVRTEDGRLLCADLKLTRDQADHLCDVLEQERQRALDPDLPRQREKAA